MNKRFIITVVCCVAATFSAQLNAQVIPVGNIYEGNLPARTNAPVIFNFSIVRLLSGQLKTQLIGRDATTQNGVIVLQGTVLSRPNGTVIGKFPFGGYFKGRFNAEGNLIAGRFIAFHGDKKLLISRRHFELPFTGHYVPAPPGFFPGPQG